jgi:putative oxidoreductase
MTRKYEQGAFILRIILGLSFFIHGFVKFQGGIEYTAQFFASIGVPGFLAYVVATIELVGGILMILGLGTRIVGLVFAALMIGAIFTAKLSVGFIGVQGAGYELDLAFLAMSLYLMITGSSFLSLDQRFTRKETFI